MNKNACKTCLDFRHLPCNLRAEKLGYFYFYSTNKPDNIAILSYLEQVVIALDGYWCLVLVAGAIIFCGIYVFVSCYCVNVE